MLYFEILLQIVAIMTGVFEIYNKKILKKDYYSEGSFIILAIAIFYSENSEYEIVKWLVFVVALIILFILFDKLFSKIKNKNRYLFQV